VPEMAASGMNRANCLRFVALFRVCREIWPALAFPHFRIIVAAADRAFRVIPKKSVPTAQTNERSEVPSPLKVTERGNGRSMLKRLRSGEMAEWPKAPDC
jgi:hypothetical protein